MHSNQDSETLPFWRLAAAFGDAARRLGALTTLLAALAAPALGGQVALQHDAGTARVWESSGISERIEIGSDRIARSAVAAEGGHVVAGEDLATGDLFFVQQVQAGSFELPAPPARSGSLRTGPVLLAEGDRLEGTVWLEGASPFESNVVASVWNGTSFERIETVSIHETGPQLALTGAVLDDGSWLVLWAGFDGTDDDIFWSRRENGVWSRPKRLHPNNRVPDILPSVLSDAEGALAAWSFFDGSDYRVRTARWTGRGWDLEEALEGRGVGSASLETVDGRSFLTFQSVVPAVWNLVEFEATGDRRLDRFSQPYRETPLIVIDNDERASLAWPWRPESERR